MEKQKNKYSIEFRTIFIMMFLMLSGTTLIRAQDLDNDGQIHRLLYTGEPKDLEIPASPHYDYLYLHLEGADGGNRKPSKKKNFAGGEGATVGLYLKIGTGTNEIPPETALRFIVGERGKTNRTVFVNGAKGGGGTGVLMQKPGQHNWVVLAVAGGGGGASSTCCDGQTGLPGEAGTSGRGGKGAESGKGGKSGGDGKDGPADATGGDGYLSALLDGSDPGTYGFGGGGYADAGGGGGGGGYSGGGAGGEPLAGGGGGSFVADVAQWSFKARNGRTTDPDHGYVEYQFTNELPGTIRLADDASKCIDVDHAKTNNGTNIKVWRCNNNNAQRWMFRKNNLRSALDGNKCLDLAYNKTDNGTNIRLWDCNGSNAQRWVYDGVSKQVRYLQNWKKCLDLESTNNGNVRLWDCQDEPNQQWKIDGATTAKGNKRVKTIHLAKDPGKCMDLYKGETANNRTNVQLWDCHGQNPQKWLFDGINIRYYALQKKCLDLDRSNTRNGTNIHLWDCNGTDAQHWVYDGLTSTIRYWKNPDKCLVVKGGSTTRGTNVQIYDCNDSDAQRWKIE